MIIESEKVLEKKLKDAVVAKGGLCLKLVTIHFFGLPDRMVLLPGGIMFFAEVKTTKQKPSKVQVLVHKKLTGLGFKVYIVDTSEIIKQLTGDDVRH